MPQSGGVVFVATRRFPRVGWYDIDSRLDYCCPAVSPPGTDRLATAEDIEEEFSIFRLKF